MKSWKTKGGCIITQVLSGRSNVYLLASGTKNILIDTSMGYMWKKLEKRLTRLKDPGIDCLILTHTHKDHAGNSCRIKKKYNATVIVHKDEALNLIAGSTKIPDGTNSVTRLLVKMLTRPFASFFNYEPCNYDVLAGEFYDLKDFGINGYIMHTPGHTAGSVSVVVDDEIALVGDTMFGIFGWSVFPPFADDPVQMINSWGKLLKTGCPVFLPSHGSAKGRELVQRDYENRVGKLRR
jgi:hydroxyacylglutathione hydrolase